MLADMFGYRLANATRTVFRGRAQPWTRLRPSTQSRSYRVPINYRMLLTSWNTLRLWMWSPMFYFNLAGICGLCGLFYAYHLERVPVRANLRKCMERRPADWKK